jgi:RimJ/RimL family protein N-acetyltransferase
MDASLAEMKSRGTDVAWLGVWERNAKAIAFYKKCGFEGVGDHIFHLGSDPQRDIVMARSIESLERSDLQRESNVTRVL